MTTLEEEKVNLKFLGNEFLPANVKILKFYRLRHALKKNFANDIVMAGIFQL
jgi:hypothetical protein